MGLECIARRQSSARASRTRPAASPGGPDYNLIFTEGKDANNGSVDLSAWVSIINLSGATYRDAKLKLVAGDVASCATAAVTHGDARNERKKPTPWTRARAFQEKAFDEFHLYTLGRPSTLPNNSTKQIELFEQAKKVPAKRELVYSGSAMGFGFSAPMTDRNFGVQGNTKVDTYLEIRNDKASGLGLPLPSGRVRVSKLDTADDTLEFIGEGRHRSHAEGRERAREARLRVRRVGERRQVDFTTDSKGRWMEEEFEIKVRNHKAQPVEVQVRENLYRWSKWNVLTKSQDFQREDARTIVVPGEGGGGRRSHREVSRSLIPGSEKAPKATFRPIKAATLRGPPNTAGSPCVSRNDASVASGNGPSSRKPCAKSTPMAASHCRAMDESMRLATQCVRAPWPPARSRPPRLRELVFHRAGGEVRVDLHQAHGLVAAGAAVTSDCSVKSSMTM